MLDLLLAIHLQLMISHIMYGHFYSAFRHSTCWGLLSDWSIPEVYLSLLHIRIKNMHCMGEHFQYFDWFQFLRFVCKCHEVFFISRGGLCEVCIFDKEIKDFESILICVNSRKFSVFVPEKITCTHAFDWLNTLHVTFTILRYRLGCWYRRSKNRIYFIRLIRNEPTISWVIKNWTHTESHCSTGQYFY